MPRATKLSAGTAQERRLAIPKDEIWAGVEIVSHHQRSSTAGYGWTVQFIPPEGGGGKEGWTRITLDHEALGLPEA